MVSYGMMGTFDVIMSGKMITGKLGQIAAAGLIKIIRLLSFEKFILTVRNVTWKSANGLHLCKWTVALIQVTPGHLNRCSNELITLTVYDVYN